MTRPINKMRAVHPREQRATKYTDEELTKLKKVKALETESWKDCAAMERLSHEIVAILEDVLKQNPHNPIALTNLGAMYSNFGRYKEALSLLKKARKLKFEDHNLYFNFGVVYVGLKRDEEARKYFKLSSTVEANDLTFKAYIDFHAL